VLLLELAFVQCLTSVSLAICLLPTAPGTKMNGLPPSTLQGKESTMYIQWPHKNTLQQQLNYIPCVGWLCFHSLLWNCYYIVHL